MGTDYRQFDQAQSYYDFVAGNLLEATITVTGHSLGGALAQYVAANNENVIGGATFGAPGLGFNLLGPEGNRAANIANYIHLSDTVGQTNVGLHVGQTYAWQDPDGTSIYSADLGMGCIDSGCLEPQDIREPVPDLAGDHTAPGWQFGGRSLLYKRDRALPSVGEILLGQKRIVAGWSGE